MTTPFHHFQDRWPLYINIHIKYTFRGAGRNEHANLVHLYSSQPKPKASTQDSPWETTLTTWSFPQRTCKTGAGFWHIYGKSFFFLFLVTTPNTRLAFFSLPLQRSRRLSKTLLRARTVHGFKSLNTEFIQSIREAKHIKIFQLKKYNKDLI